MPKTHLLVALAVLLAGPATAVAGSAEYQSLDAMGLASGKGMKTPCKISGEYEGKTYCFRNEDAKAEFMKDADGNRAKADSYAEESYEYMVYISGGPDQWQRNQFY